VEVIAGDTIPSYGESQGMALSEAKHLTSWTLMSMVTGYILGILAIPRFISQARALQFSALLGCVIALAALFLDGQASVACIALLGLANALMWPAIWPLAIEGLGRHTKTASALLIMAIAGGAVLPPIYGALAGMTGIGPRQAYWMLIPCYLLIGWYALRGARMRRWSGTAA
jgi:fucose permease